MKLEMKHAMDAVSRLSILAFFPSDKVAKQEIALLFMRMVDTVEHLDWLRITFVDRIGQWHGAAELRAVYCNRFKPLDGIEADSAIPGFTAEDSEAANALEAHEYKRIEKGDTPPVTKMIEGNVKEARDSAWEAQFKARTEALAETPVTIGPTPVRTESERTAELEKLTRALAERHSGTVQ
jgi:hypothetical protein